MKKKNNWVDANDDIEIFMDRTKADEADAVYFLVTCQGDLESAIDLYTKVKAKENE